MFCAKLGIFFLMAKENDGILLKKSDYEIFTA